MSEKEKSAEKLIATNPAARANFQISDTFEAGLALQGTEVKSLRQQSPNLRDSFVDITQSGHKFEAWLLNAHIPPYSHGNIWNHDPVRRRKLLLHTKEIETLWGALTQKGLTIVPMRLYFKKGRIKVEIGLGKGKKKEDRREDVKARSADREIERAMKQDRKRQA